MRIKHMKKGIWKILLFGLFITVSILCFWEIGTKIFIKYWGEKVVAVVTGIPAYCGKFSHMVVLLNNVEYEVSISSSECWGGVYKQGQHVELLKHDYFEQLIWPESRPDLFLLILVVLIGYIILVQEKTRITRIANKKKYDKA
jgi:hypothetical protein